MSFQFPLGLLGLIGIPVLILIYIIKSQYTEQTIASTYIWRLSEKFLKKRKPVSKLTGILKLLLQILAVIAVSLLIAHPVFTIPHSANDIFFILDCSASMNMTTDGGATRFERAQQRINKIIDQSRGGSTYSLVYAGETTDMAFEDVRDKAQAKSDVSALKAGWCNADCSSAVVFAQKYFTDNNSAIVYLVTDKPYETQNIRLIDVSGGESNYAFTEYGYEYTSAGVRGTGKVISYSSDATLTVKMTLGGAAEEGDLSYETTVETTGGDEAEFFIQADVSSFTSLRLSIVDNDALKEDNEVVLFDAAKAQARRVLLVNKSTDGTYIKNAIASAGGAAVDEVTPEKFSLDTHKGYGMYVFNCTAPKELPKNAAIWLVNAVDGSGDTATGISYRDTCVPADATGPESYYVPKYSTGTSAREKQLLKGITENDFAIRQYARYGVPTHYASLIKVGGDTVVAAGLNENNDRQTVFAFAIGDTNFGMQSNFLALVRNLMNYSFPSVLEETTYTCGDVMNVNVISGCESIVVTSPSGKSTTLDTVDHDVCGVQLSETGTYTLTVKVAGVEDTVLFAYACVPEEESGIPEAGYMALAGEKSNEYSDGFYDKLLPFFILIAAFMLADWGLYCYEQYQLR